MTRRCVLKAALTGAMDGRRHDAVFSILRSKEDVLRYLVFLLGDPSYDALFAQLAGVDGRRFRIGSHRDLDERWTSHCSSHWSERPVGTRTRSPGWRASSRNSATLPNGDELVPDGFDELWDVVWQVHQERRA